jgi:hypothetical protein
VDNIKEVEEKDLYVMRLEQFSTGKDDPYRAVAQRDRTK